MCESLCSSSSTLRKLPTLLLLGTLGRLNTVDGLNLAQLTEITELVGEAAHLTGVGHDGGRLAEEEGVVAGPDVDDVLSLSSTHSHNLLTVAEHL